MFYAFYKSPIGLLEIKGSEKGISAVNFIDDNITAVTAADCPSCLSDCEKQLDEYFSHKRKSFDLNFDISGTEFQKKVWNELLKIPFGKTCSYLDMANKLGDKMALRAVGNANGRNPVAIIIPCHRVIGNDGKLVGYGGGLWRKKWLLDFENPNNQKELF
ncbi:MAG: methylated-DNA--[protein]-cysteine S-methyltransferase [Bacteroidota bacterium]